MFSFTWQDINVTVFEKTKTFWKTTTRNKTILDNVSGSSRSNSLFAIMGSSGSGKTTLLRAISGRCRQKTGLLQVNDNFISDDDIRDISGYVPQQDIFVEHLTVLEHLEFMAALQRKTRSRKKHQSIIKQLLSELSLERQNCTLIKNLSGGEKRRLSLASELISNPFILFCDEPTTGLDSYNSVVVVEKLQTIALSGKIVIITIHQPSSQLFHYFNNITLLAEGKLVFQGTTEEAKSFFESMDLFYPENYNPADFYIRCLTGENVQEMCKMFIQWKTSQSTIYCSHCNHVDNILLDKQNKNNFFHELKWLMWRNYLSIKRNKWAHLGTYFVVLIELVMVSFFYSKISFTDRESAQNIEGFIAFIGSEFTFTNMYSVINVFPSEVEVFIREKTLYSSCAYFISKILSVIPLSLLSTMLYMTILFTIIKFLNGFYLWVQMTYLTFLVSMAASALGLAFSATFSTVDHIDLYLGPLEFLLLLLSGLMVKLDVIPVALRWLKYLSPFYYAFDSLSNLLWKDVTNIGNCAGNETIPCYSNGTEVLRNYGIYKSFNTVTYDILYLHLLATALCLIGFGGIVRKKILYNI
ncbi:hypothetical protein Zmor_002661 [Zophobas morio]|uniref:ABC transporter domain-containing protein n=1 Tax=Zophobas morio TaxID=2755281 RepID=A0AA38HL90_9CUCU|nr:hypothetical protein Zmor_002661 [Zophobas morio]